MRTKKFTTKPKWLIIKAMKSCKQQMKPKIPVLNKKVKLKIERKSVVFVHTLRSIVVKITKLFILPIRKKI